MVLNMAQTWHQSRPGEVRNDCGGCHSHSQKPTDFNLTAAAKPTYVPFDLTRRTPLLTTKKNDQSGKQWDINDETGLRYVTGAFNVEYHRDIKPILQRSCVACHGGKAEEPAGGLVLDDESRQPGQNLPGTYRALVHPKDTKSMRYTWPFQSRNRYLTWRIFGRRTDGFPEKIAPGTESDHAGHLARGGLPFSPSKGSIMPPADAVKSGKVAPLTDEDRRMIVRWIDLGCPIDHDFDAKNPDRRGNGWMLDDQRPTLTLTYPQAGANKLLTRIVVGMYDYGTGLDMESFQVTADFPIANMAAGTNLAKQGRSKADGVFEFVLPARAPVMTKGTLTVSVCDRQGNTTRIVRTFSVGP